VIDGVLIEVLGGNSSLDDLLLDLLAELLSGDILRVLGRNDNGVNTLGNNGTAVLLVLDGDLSFGVRAQPRKRAITAGSSHGSVQLVGELKSKGEELRGLISGIAEHDTLVTSAEILKSLIVVKTLSDIRGLLLNSDEQVEGLIVEAFLGAVVTDVLDGITDNLLVVDVGTGGDLSEDHDHTGLGGSLASDLGEGVLSQAGIENGIGNLIGNLVGVALTDGFGL
jgi:hypothetical protein